MRLLRDCGGDAELVHWSRAGELPGYDAYVLPGGFAYEDRIRAGAIAAHDRIMDAVIEGAGRGKLVFGICNGAQTLLEAGLVPGTGGARRPTAAFTRNAPVPHFTAATFICGSRSHPSVVRSRRRSRRARSCRPGPRTGKAGSPQRPSICARS